MSVRIMTAVWDSSPYEGARLLLHLAMADHANDSGWFFAAQESLARKARCSVEYVRLSVIQMVEDGLLEIARKGSSKGRATEYRLLPAPPNSVGESLPKTVGESRTSPPNPVGESLPNFAGSLPNSAWGQPSFTTVLENKDAAPADAVAVVEPVEETLGQHTNRLARTYTDLVPLSNFPAVAGVVRKAIRTGLYSDGEIVAALQRLVSDSRGLTVETLRVELEGLPAARRGPSAVDAYLAAADTLDARGIGA